MPVSQLCGCEIAQHGQVLVRSVCRRWPFLARDKGFNVLHFHPGERKIARLPPKPVKLAPERILAYGRMSPKPQPRINAPRLSDCAHLRPSMRAISLPERAPFLFAQLSADPVPRQQPEGMSHGTVRLRVSFARNTPRNCSPGPAYGVRCGPPSRATCSSYCLAASSKVRPAPSPRIPLHFHASGMLARRPAVDGQAVPGLT